MLLVFQHEKGAKGSVVGGASAAAAVDGAAVDTEIIVFVKIQTHSIIMIIAIVVVAGVVVGTLWSSRHAERMVVKGCCVVVVLMMRKTGLWCSCKQEHYFFFGTFSRSRFEIVHCIFVCVGGR